MSLKSWAAGGFIAALCAGAVRSQPVQSPPPLFDFAQVRQASLDMSANVRSQMESAMLAGKESKTQAYAAFALARWAHVLPLLFPAGSGPGEAAVPTQAKPEVWNDRAGFNRAAAHYGEAADKLAALAKANDTEGFKAQLVVLHQACDACHAAYKAGDQGPPK